MMIIRMESDAGDLCKPSETLDHLTIKGSLCPLLRERETWYRWYRQFTILLYYISPINSKWVIHNIENIVITELKIRFLPPDLTLVQSEMVVLGVLGYSRTQHAGFDDEGILSVSGHRHLGELTGSDQDN